MKISLLVISSIVSLCLVQCGRVRDEAAASTAGTTPRAKPVILVANYPLKYFAQQIGGESIDVRFPAPANEDPAFWQPDDDAISQFQKADLILMNGASYSKWTDKVTLPASKIVDTSSSFQSTFIEEKGAITHSHGPGGEHSHNGIAFTTWIDFYQAIAQAKAVRAGISRVRPDDAKTIDANTERLAAEMGRLDNRMLAVGKRMNGQPVVASHPVFQYWARRYGINLKSVLWEPEEAPTDKQMEELKTLLATHKAKWMVWEGVPAKEGAEKIKTMGLQGVVFDPCANNPEKGDFLSIMKANVEGIENAFP